MSQQSTPLGASGFDIDVVRNLKTAIARAVTAVQSQRQAHAKRAVRSIEVRLYRDEGLAGYGWSTEDIRRLTSE